MRFARVRFRGSPDGPLENPSGTGERAAAADSGPSLGVRYAFSRLRGAVRLLWARTSSAPVFCEPRSTSEKTSARSALTEKLRHVSRANVFSW